MTLAHFGNSLSELSRSSIIDSGDFASACREIVVRVARTLKVARASIWMLSPSLQTLECIALAHDGQIADEPNPTLHASQYPKYFKALQAERAIIANNALQHPDTADFVAGYLLPLGITSMMDMPIRQDGHLVGILCCEHVGSERQWQTEEHIVAGTFADVAGRALTARHCFEAEQALRVLNTRLEQLVEQRTRELTAALKQLTLSQQHLIQNEKMAALGVLVAGVAHEINTPLGIAVTAASHLAEQFRPALPRFRTQPLDPQCRDFIELLDETLPLLSSVLSRAADQVRSFKQIAVNQSDEQPNEFVLHEAIHDLMVSFRVEFRRHQVQFNSSCPPDITMAGYPGALCQILTILVMNSLTHAFHEQPAPRIHLHAEARGERVIITYSDNGCGIAAEHQRHIFEPFYTTRRHQGGSGLGLSILYNVLHQRLKGSVHMASDENQGVTFTLQIPRRLS